MIRRNRKRKYEQVDGQISHRSPLSRTPGTSKEDDSNLQSHLASDIDVTRERLSGLDNSQHNSLGALSSLSEACAAVWHDASEFDKMGGNYFLFEDQVVSWVDSE